MTAVSGTFQESNLNTEKKKEDIIFRTIPKAEIYEDEDG